MTVRRLAVSDCLQSYGLTSKGLSLCLFELNYNSIRGERSGLKHWTEMTEGTRNVLRTFEETHAISAMASSTKQDTRKSVLKRITGDKHRKGLGTSRVDVCRSGRRFSFSEFNYKDARHRLLKKTAINHCA